MTVENQESSEPDRRSSTEPTVSALLEARQRGQKSERVPHAPWRQRLRDLYIGTDRRAIRFQWAVASIDLVIIVFFILSPVLQDLEAFLWLDYTVALLLTLDLAARAFAANDFKRWLRRPVVLVDLVVLATLLAPLWLVNLGFLRVLRLWSLSQNDIFWRSLRRRGYREWEDVGRAGINLITCLFVITGFIYTFFARPGSGIEGWVDALYYTVATITTTGFGDITLPGTAGKLTSIVAMIVGISLFVRLAQALFRPYKVSFRCPQCALLRHEPDAVHCKACGHLLAIPNSGTG
ncbi:potassium channel family protein [Tianweitania sediminis]|uniref:Two pore domain potassium channel family protein n=1 Tax=Tianweitania sediminis TaxID=1502156 RepID=A0A8J7QYG0_9HYPH|nr:potassium channel family protein [Tianweitania sediminis]MBP0438260.1 two pore domain potassium channel family protein [Tianweitania sediminis]